MLLPYTLLSFATIALAGVALPTGHPWIPAGYGDVRSPCPGLNTLANHGYLPRTGKNVQRSDFSTALGTVFNLTEDAAAFFINAALTCCGTTPTGGVDLSALALHNAIERDVSLVHRDAAPNATFAPTTPDPLLLADLLHHGPNGIDIKSLAQTRIDRLRKYGKALLPAQEGRANLEAGLVWFTMREPQTDAGIAPVQKLAVWLSLEKLPPGFQTPSEAVTLQTLGGLQAKVAQAIVALGGV